jgi:hypothetical protein
MRLELDVFFSGFCDYLSRAERASTLAYISVMNASEHWLKFEALSWLHYNRAMVGLGGGDTRKPACTVQAEKHDYDIWLQDREVTPNRRGAAIQFKMVYNNKNFGDKVETLRNEVRDTKPVPGFAAENVQRYGIAALIYLRGVSEYQILRKKAWGEPCSPAEFLALFDKECRSEDICYVQAPVLDKPLVSLDDQPYIDPPGCAVWLTMLKMTSPACL